jgi:hypothetical protein
MVVRVFARVTNRNPALVSPFSNIMRTTAKAEVGDLEPRIQVLTPQGLVS